MQIEVDQSGKVEDTKVNTAIGAANKKVKRSLRFPAREKRKLQKILRELDKESMFPYRVFAALIFLAIRDDLSSINEIVIDVEYMGKEAQIKLYLARHIRKIKPKVNMPYITFKHIGRNSPAHEVAINTFRRHRKPDYTVSVRDILPLLFSK